MKKMAVLVALLMVFACASAQAAMLGINFTGGGAAVTSGGAPGYVCTNWNNGSGPWFSGSGLQDDAAVGSVSFSWNSGRTSVWEGNWGPGIMDGQQKAHYYPQYATISNISSLGYSSYSALIYTGGTSGDIGGQTATYVSDSGYTYLIVTGLTADTINLNTGEANWAAMEIVQEGGGGAVPEPAGLGLIGAALLFLKRRRS